MGYLSQAFNTYYNSTDNKQKDNLKKDFQEIIWKSLPYTKLNRFFKYKISYDNIKDKDALGILEKYQFIEYKILKSRYNINELGKEDLIKARINSNYGKYFDNEVYFKKEYYRALAEYKNIYFNYLNGKVNNLEELINNNDELIDRLKQESLSNKYNMSWKDYKAFINMCFDKIFDNYKPIEYAVGNGDFKPNHILDWDEDNYILCYVNKSLNGYLKDYIKEVTGFKYKYKWKHNLVKYIELDGVEKYSALQLCVGKYYKTNNDILVISDKNFNKLSKKQKVFIMQVENILENYTSKEVILFNEYGLPCINELFVSKVLNKPQRSVNMMVASINRNINKSDEFKYCEVCGNKIISGSNKTKYCKSCAKDILQEQKNKWKREKWNKEEK